MGQTAGLRFLVGRGLCCGPAAALACPGGQARGMSPRVGARTGCQRSPGRKYSKSWGVGVRGKQECLWRCLPNRGQGSSLRITAPQTPLASQPLHTLLPVKLAPMSRAAGPLSPRRAFSFSSPWEALTSSQPHGPLLPTTAGAEATPALHQAGPHSHTVTRPLQVSVQPGVHRDSRGLGPISVSSGDFNAGPEPSLGQK